MHPALYWKMNGDKVMCQLCPRACVLADGQLGACGVRRAENGKLFAMSYGQPCAVHVDPVEKKPLFHFYPGQPILSLATIGCNLFCDFCQNWEISKARVESMQEEKEISPQQIVAMAKEADCRLIAFTYTEPTVYFEYALDIAKQAKKKGMECAIVSNGYTSEEATRAWAPYLSAANIDLKGTAQFYRKRCKVPDFECIKRTIVLLKELGVHVEVTNLVIPGENDTDKEFERIALWMKENVGKETPLHFSAFHPDYRMLDTPSTPARTLLRAREIAKRHLDYVYIGNAPGVDDHTYCPKCHAIVIERNVYQGVPKLDGKSCPSCGTAITGRFAKELQNNRRVSF
jgi:pyruvate formate lyase activating enzyme